MAELLAEFAKDFLLRRWRCSMMDRDKLTRWLMREQANETLLRVQKAVGLRV
ncbi:hypothetical protein IPL44_03260 [Candidatus Saccharibacteria bacterium]|nr:MAG: hypothetical protein IPL44_03260 [Candidatus Saccharibacteria bacterium]